MYPSYKFFFIGDTPSKKNKFNNKAFVGSQSYKKLLNWIPNLDLSINDIEIYNKDDEFKISQSVKYIALGVNASKNLAKRNIDHFKLPHPSGCNYQLNDKKFVKKVLKECRDWCHSS